MKSRFTVAAVVVAGAGVLSACATEKSDTGRREYDRSVADYENCIAANQMGALREAERRLQVNLIEKCCSAATPHTEQRSSF